VAHPDEDNPPPQAAEQALSHALKLLRHRDRSRHELALALSRKGFSDDVAQSTLSRLMQLGYLDDLRFARARAASLLSAGRLGEASVRARLLAHGLSDSEVDSALKDAMSEVGFDALAAGRALLLRRRWWGRTLDAREQARAARFLSSRGFSEDVVERLLHLASVLESPQ